MLKHPKKAIVLHVHVQPTRHTHVGVTWGMVEVSSNPSIAGQMQLLQTWRNILSNFQLSVAVLPFKILQVYTACNMLSSFVFDNTLDAKMQKSKMFNHNVPSRTHTISNQRQNAAYGVLTPQIFVTSMNITLSFVLYVFFHGKGRDFNTIWAPCYAKLWPIQNSIFFCKIYVYVLHKSETHFDAFDEQTLSTNV